ncbi:hypothetical protein NQ318_012563 [Aromia moschata]|uniref:Phospholipase A2-like domain-containing protein n=1 Tax=Aromia moschata TaxID=1265417 RepID=A0AAV8YM68_9CUCU|nr:hypothetical protein NQ318_012563 [Aromia moschata]
MGKRKNISSIIRRKTPKKGRGLLNTLINKLPVELHIPGYRYCGPGTKLEKRLERGDQGVNPLDEACKVHDIAYSQFKDTTSRNIADRELAEAATKRLKASDARLGEKIAAFGVANIMKAKSKLGMGLKKGRSKKRGGTLKRKSAKKTRVIPIPKTGGFLPLLFPLLGALGALGGGAAGIAKAVNDSKANRQQLEEEKRHNLAMEAAATGKGLYLAPYKKGYGLYLSPNRKNYQ